MSKKVDQRDQKGKQAIDTLNQAYSAFVDLAHYNAGEEAKRKPLQIRHLLISMDSLRRLPRCRGGGGIGAHWYNG